MRIRVYTGIIGSLICFLLFACTNNVHAPILSNDRDIEVTLQKLDEISTGGDSYDVRVVDDLVYVTCGYGGLRIFNVSDPSDIIQVGYLPEWSNGYSHQMAIDNDVVYIGDGRGGLWGINCTDPTNPTTSTNFLGGYTWDVQIDANADIAFLADGGSFFGVGENGLKILDIHNKSSPVLLGQYITGGDATDIEIIDNTVYLVTGSTGLMIFDVSNYSNPILLGHVLEPFDELQASLGSVKVLEDLLYMAYWQGGLFLYNVSNPSNITVVGEFLKGDELFSIELDEELNLAFVVDQSEGLKILDIIDPSNPHIVSNFSDDSTIYSDVYYSGDYLYLIADTGLKTFKIDIDIDEETTTSTSIETTIEKTTTETSTTETGESPSFEIFLVFSGLFISLVIRRNQNTKKSEM